MRLKVQYPYLRLRLRVPSVRFGICLFSISCPLLSALITETLKLLQFPPWTSNAMCCWDAFCWRRAARCAVLLLIRTLTADCERETWSVSGCTELFNCRVLPSSSLCTQYPSLTHHHVFFCSIELPLGGHWQLVTQSYVVMVMWR